MKAWYLLYCKPRNEIRAQQNLSLQHINTYLPMVQQQSKNSRGKLSIKSVPLFPGYLFVRFDPEVTAASMIRNTRGVAGIVDCREKMQPLCHLVYSVKRQERLLGVIDLTEGVQSVVHSPNDEPEEIQHEFSHGEMVEFIDGPFKSLTGIFEQQDDKARCIILMEVLGRLQTIKVAKQVLTPIVLPQTVQKSH
ncbi:MAG: transcription termination/antitermination NusG family protein [Shewanella sp.]